MATYIYTYDGNKYHYQGYVKDINGNSIWEAHYPEFIEDDKSSEVIETSNIFDEGVNNPEDIEGVENYLKSIGVLNQNDELVDESGYMGEGEEDEEEQEMAKGGLIASSSTLDGIKKMIGNYYYSSNISLKKIDNTNEYEVYNAKGKIDSVKVIEKKGRFRFEFISKSNMARGGRAAEYETYHKTLASALSEAQNFVENRGYEFSEETYFPDLTMGGVKYGQTISSTRDVVEVGGKNRKNTLVIVVYRMDSGTYELTMYFTKSKYAQGGETSEGIDLFEDYENIPPNVQKVLDKYQDAFMDGDYQGLLKAHKELGKIGYTFEYYLDGQAYDLRPIGTKGKSEDDDKEYMSGGSLSKEFYVEFTWNDGYYDSRAVYIKADTEEEAEEKVTQKFGKAYEGFKIIQIQRSMKTGGKLETQSKNKLKATFELPLELVVYVPSTTTADKKISDKEFDSRIDYVETYLSDLFGGYSATEVEGGYVSDEKGLIQEDVMKVTAFGQVDNFEDKFNQLLHQVKIWCEEWGQESIGFEFEGDLFYINKDSKFKDGGYMADGGMMDEPKYDSAGFTREDDKRIKIYSGNKGKLNEIFNEYKNQKNELTANEVFDNEKMKGKSVFLFVNDDLYDQYVQDEDEEAYADENFGFAEGGYMADGGGVDYQYPTDLKVGSIIMGVGFPMLKGIDNDKYYKVVELDNYSATFVLTDSKGKRSGVKKVRHKLSNLEGGIKSVSRGDNNGIEVIKYADGGMMANGGYMAKGGVTIGDLNSMVREYNEDGRSFELRGAYGYLELWSKGNRLEVGSKKDIYNALVKYRFNEKYADGGITVTDERLKTMEQSDEERELELYIDNDVTLYNQRKFPIEKNLIKKVASGTFDINQAPKIYMFLINDGIKKYTKDFGGISLSKSEKENLAKDYVNKFLDDADGGQFDEFIPKKYKMAEGGEMDDELLEFEIPDWALPSLINGDDSGLENEDIEKLDKFVAETIKEYGNANFMLPSEDEMDLGFLYNNDIDNLGSNCSLLYLRPSKGYADGGETDDYAKGGEVRYKLKGSNFGQQIESGQKFKALISKAFENQSGEQKYPENFIKEIAYTGKIVKNEGSNFLKDYSYKGTLTKFEFLDDKDFVEALKYLDRPSIKSFKFEKGGVTFDEKVSSISKSLLKRKKVSPSVQKDYGKTYNKKEAIESAKRIAGKIRAKEMSKKKD
jgi:hypothetical protein